jgi:hypothetical protein
MMDVFACAGSVFGFFLLLAFLLGWRYINYRESLALAEKGLLKPDHKWSFWSENIFNWRLGVIITGLGLAITLGFWPLGAGYQPHFFLGLNPWMLFGFLPLFFGLSLILIHIISNTPKSVGTTPIPQTNSAAPLSSPSLETTLAPEPMPEPPTAEV